MQKQDIHRRLPLSILSAQAAFAFNGFCLAAFAFNGFCHGVEIENSPEYLLVGLDGDISSSDFGAKSLLLLKFLLGTGGLVVASSSASYDSFRRGR